MSEDKKMFYLIINLSWVLCYRILYKK